MDEVVPVNPDVLRWARVSLGLSIEQVAQRLKRDAAEIEAWERGEIQPTYVQLETLAYKVYRRPLALFFFPEPPEEQTPHQSFRTLPVEQLERIPSRIRYLIRKAGSLQANLAELYPGGNPAERFILRDLKFATSVSPEAMARRVRDHLGVTLSEQQRWAGADAAFRQWRQAVESFGMFVFKDSFRTSGALWEEDDAAGFCGFCLYDETFPLIYINNNKPPTRQTFTLFHELAHLLMRTGGVDTRRDEYIDSLTGDARRIEVLCNRFAAALLVPREDLEPRLDSLGTDDRTVAQLAELYAVSREVILRCILDRGLITRREYELRAHRWADEVGTSRGGGGNYYATRGVYLGRRYIERVMLEYHENRISLEQAAEFLDEKVRNVPGLEAWLASQGG